MAAKHGDRHPSTVQLLRWLEPNVNLPMEGLAVANQMAVTADILVGYCSDGPELTVGLRKLLEAKDCLVRAALSAPAES